MTCEEDVTCLSRQGVSISHCRQIKRTSVREDNVRTSKPLPIWATIVENAKENLSTLKHVRGIHHFNRRIEDFKNFSKSMQCFGC